MKTIIVTMIDAGSGFVVNAARGISEYESLQDATFVLMDVGQGRLDKAAEAVIAIFAKQQSKNRLEVTSNLSEAWNDSNYVLASCEQNRYPNWIKDIEIPMRHGVYQLTGEDGGPGGIIHGMA
jgi:alpha-galactosidase/6-phospho-beta-glucosidase family protein